MDDGFLAQDGDRERILTAPGAKFKQVSQNFT